MVLRLNPDWTTYWTKHEAEQLLVDSFHFKGIGWYFTEHGEAILVSNAPEISVHDANEPFKKYRFDYWFNNPLDSFKWIVNAPVRS